MVIKKRRERAEPEIPSASLPDIVFQLLIFFLVTTTIDVDKGLDLTLPPIGDVLEIHKKNISNLLINDLGQILIDQLKRAFEVIGTTRISIAEPEEA